MLSKGSFWTQGLVVALPTMMIGLHRRVVSACARYSLRCLCTTPSQLYTEQVNKGILRDDSAQRLALKEVIVEPTSRLC